MKFLDTCTLMNMQQSAFRESFLISSITLSELESIKSSNSRDEEAKWQARKILHLLEEKQDDYEIILYNEKLCGNIINNYGLINNNDSKIIASAYLYYLNQPDTIFITSDLACRALARSIGLPVEFMSNEYQDDEYHGYKEIKMNDEELADFYSNIYHNNINIYSLNENEYLLILNQENEIIDKYKWKDNQYYKINYLTIESSMFGKISPKDTYQLIAMDSLYNNQLTVMRGKPGSGKSLLGLSYLIAMLEKGKIDKIVIFVNSVAVRGAAKLGFYPGDKNDKLLDSQIGNFLVSKLGSITEVEKMIDEGTLELVPVADCRGMDTTGMHAGCYITEAQNTNIDMMKLLLQRIGDDSIVVIEGDDKTQVDMSEYAGINNGLKRLSKVFRGQPFYGEVSLSNVYRGKIAARAELM